VPYGNLTPDMEATIKEFVVGKTVWDLGSGDFAYARKLLEWGAQHVVAVDKEPLGTEPDGCTCIETYFHSVRIPRGGIGVVWLSWPQNCPLPGLVQILERVPLVIYLGSNTGGSACGNPPLWDHFTQRTILHYTPHRQSSLIVYGWPCGRRLHVGEEIGATCGEMLGLAEAENIASNHAQILGFNPLESA